MSPSPDFFTDRAEVAARHGALVNPPLMQRLPAVLVVAMVLGLAVLAMTRLEFSFARLGSGLVQLGTFLTLMVPPSPGGMAITFFKALGETVAIAVLGTTLAAVLAFPLGFLAARGVIGGAVLRFLTRRFSDSLRGVDTLIWALIWINVVGLGPFAGVLALITSDLGLFTKMFSEAIETADRKPSEGVVAAGGSRVHAIRFGLIPQVLPVFISQWLYMIESNTRSATIIGIVGAGGIGLHLAEMIRTYEWDRVAFIVLIVLATVALIDFLSTKIRLAVIGERAAA
ncbi:MAG: phosphonate ABC transporter, permease protein PhnE [Proteobacteria bacterium]|nr:phosphonate ABC transporter, permease protein PhnE [Pseudomonadota bacterium]